jgi:chemotaxis protein methyltransferase WspC
MDIAAFEDLLKAAMGLNAPSIGSSAIARAVDERVAACGFKDRHAYGIHVRASAAELQELIDAVVVPETSFFRDRESFAALAQLVSEEWLKRPWEGVLRALSLPCSTGEEPYSIAMALLDAGIPAVKFRVDAMDISTRALRHAGRAVYGRNAFRGCEREFRDRHFTVVEGGYRVNDEVRQQVRFAQGNLLAPDLRLGSVRYEIVFCRNVLIYFDRPTQDRALGVLKGLVTEDGVLFVAPAETGIASSHRMTPVDLPRSFAFRQPRAVVSAREPLAAAVPRPPAASLAALPPRAPARAPASRATMALPRPVGPVSPTKPPAATVDLGDASRLANEGRFAEAAACCEAHSRQHGPSAAGFYVRGLIYDATGKQADAQRCFRKALYLDPDHGEAQIHLALLLETQGNTAGARVLRDRVRRLGERTGSRA